MKRILMLACLAGSFRGDTQNIGIGTTSPLATIDVRGNERVGGLSKYIGYDSLSGKISWINSSLFIPAPQAIITHSASAEGLYYGNGKLFYRSISDTAFYTDWITGNGYFKGQVGIGTTTAAVKLDIRGANGWDLQSGEGDMRVGNASYRLKFGVALDGGGAGAANIMQYGNPAGFNALSLGSQGNYLLRLYGNNKVIEMATDATAKVGIGTGTPTERLEVTGNIKANSYKFTSPKTYYYSIPDGAFTARSSTEKVEKSYGAGGAYISNGGIYGLVVPVHLPQGARVTNVSVDFYDASVTQNLTLYFARQFQGGFYFDVTIASTGNAGLNTQSTALSPSLLIDNSNTAYEIFVLPTPGSWTNDDLAIRRVILAYTLDEAQ